MSKKRIIILLIVGVVILGVIASFIIYKTTPEKIISGYYAEYETPTKFQPRDYRYIEQDSRELTKKAVIEFPKLRKNYYEVEFRQDIDLYYRIREARYESYMKNVMEENLDIFGPSGCLYVDCSWGRGFMQIIFAPAFAEYLNEDYGHTLEEGVFEIYTTQFEFWENKYPADGCYPDQFWNDNYLDTSLYTEDNEHKTWLDPVKFLGKFFPFQLICMNGIWTPAALAPFHTLDVPDEPAPVPDF